MHRYRLFEVGHDGSLHDTGKIVECLTPNSYYDRGDAVSKVLELYGFQSPYDNYYKPEMMGDDIAITYNYVNAGGLKNTWYLKRSI